MRWSYKSSITDKVMCEGSVCNRSSLSAARTLTASQSSLPQGAWPARGAGGRPDTSAAIQLYSCLLATGREKELTTSLASRISRSLLTKAFSAPSALFFQMDTSDSLPDSKLCTLCTLVQATQDSPHHQPPSPSHITSHPPTSPATLILPHHQSPSPPTSPVTLTPPHHQSPSPPHHQSPSPSHITSRPHPPISPVTLTPHITSHPHPPTSPVTSPAAPEADSAAVPLPLVLTGGRSPTAEE